jgi:TatD DNase family protein
MDFLSMVFSDSHIHIAALDEALLPGMADAVTARSPVCAASHSVEDFARTRQIAQRSGAPVFLSFGVHPQNPNPALIPFLEALLKENAVHAVGEAGFDLFTDEYKADIARQEEAWRAQTELAASFCKPLVIHCRKALHLIFRDYARLAKIPACVFHSFAGSPLEAGSLLKRGVNAYFSFGKPLLNSNKRAIYCVRELPLEHLLAETDAPYQRLKGETQTERRDIIRVHEAIAAQRGIGVEKAAGAIAGNFFGVFGGAG